MFFKDLLNEYERLEIQRGYRLKQWSNDEDIKKEQTEIFDKIVSNKNVLKYYNHVQWPLNDQDQVKDLRIRTEAQIKDNFEQEMKIHEAELANVHKKAGLIWSHLLAGKGTRND